MNEKILISVVVPCYNIEKYVKKCIDSILNQTYKHIEVIIVDDGSTDDTYKIIKAYRDNRIKILRQKNAGLSAARNSGLKQARGKYICFIDGDDYINEKYIEIMTKEARKTNSDIVVCGYERVDEKGSRIDKKAHGKNCEFTGREAVADYLHYMDVVSIVAWNKLYKIDIFKKNGIEYPIARLNEDVYTTYKTFYFSNNVKYINTPLYYYVKRSGSITDEEFSAKRFRNIICIIDDTKHFLEENNYKTISGDDNDIKIFEINMLSFALSRAIKNGIICNERRESIYRLKKYKKYIYSLPYISRTARLLSPFLPLLVGRIFYKIARYIAVLFLRLTNDVKTIILSIIPGKKLFILNAPTHGNLGDQAILDAEVNIIHDVLGRYRVIEVTNGFCTHFSCILKIIIRNAPVCLHGGGYLGDLWPKEDRTIIHILQKFKNNKMICFPQTFCSKDANAYFSKTRREYELNNNLTIFARDKYTYDTLSKKINVKICYVPDIVLYNNREEHCKNKVITICLRNDHEKTIDIEKESKILFAARKRQYEIIDTVIDQTIFRYNRKKEIRKILEKIGRSELLITDRLHGMVFAYLTKTPCLVFNSRSPKVKGVYQWIKKADYIKLHEKGTSIEDEIDSMLNTKFAYNETVCRTDFEKIADALRKVVE